MTTDDWHLANGVLLPGFTGHRVPDWLAAELGRGLAGVVLFAQNTPDLVATRALCQDLARASGGGAVVAIDEEGGDVTRLFHREGSPLPAAAAFGTADRPDLTREAGRAEGALLAAVGVTLNFAPCLDINSCPDNPVIGARAFGATADTVMRHGLAFAEGLRSAGVGACGKHFPGHGDTSQDSHVTLPSLDITADQLQMRELAPYAALIEAGELDAVMMAHIVSPLWGSQPASLSPQAVGLARALGFRGLIVSDAMDMGALASGGFGDSCVAALAAGTDLLCLGTTHQHDDRDLYELARDAIVAALAGGHLDRQAMARSAYRRELLNRPHPTPGATLEPLVDHLTAIGREVARLAAHLVGSKPPSVPPSRSDPDRRQDHHPAVAFLDARVTADHASGTASPYVTQAVMRRWPGALVVASVSEVPADRRLIVHVRSAARGSAERAALEQVLAARPDATVLFTGAPSAAPAQFDGLRYGALVVAGGGSPPSAEASLDLVVWPAVLALR